MCCFFFNLYIIFWRRTNEEEGGKQQKKEQTHTLRAKYGYQVEHQFSPLKALLGRYYPMDQLIYLWANGLTNFVSPNLLDEAASLTCRFIYQNEHMIFFFF